MSPSSPTLLAPTRRPQRTVGDAYLEFQLDDRTPVVLPMNAAQEVLILPAQRLTSMPNMPAFVLGLLNRRSRILWLIDLAHIMGLAPLAPDLRQYNVAIIRTEVSPLALAVQRVKGVKRLPSNSIQPLPGLMGTEMIPYLQGCILQKTAIAPEPDPPHALPPSPPPEVLLVLDAGAIVKGVLSQIGF